MAETLTIREILEREGACIVVMRGDHPVKAYDKYPAAKKEADRLTFETGEEHVAAMFMKYP